MCCPSDVFHKTRFVRVISRHNNPTVSKSNKAAEPTYSDIQTALRESARVLNVPPFEVATRIESMQADVESLKKQVAELSESGDLSADSLIERAEDIAGAKIIVTEAKGANPNLMRQLIDQIRKMVEPSAIFLAACQDEKVLLVAGVSRDLVEKGASAGNWVKEVAPVVGGGKPDVAQAGGKQPEKLPEALDAAKEEIRNSLADDR